MIDPHSHFHSQSQSQSHSEFVCQPEYSDEDSDCTEEETLIMLNFPQLNFDEGKLKMLNVIRKRETNETTPINGDIKGVKKGTKESPEKEKRRKKNFRKEQSVGILNSENSCTHMFNLKSTVEEKTETEKEHNGKELKGKKKEKEKEKEEETEKEEGEEKEEEEEEEREGKKKRKKQKQEHKQEQEQKLKQKNNKEENEKREKEKDIEKKKEKDKESGVGIKVEEGTGTGTGTGTGEFLFKIESITMENVFSEAPKCILNNKYEFTGIQTSSIGTNLFFKEPQSMKQDSDLDNEDLNYDCTFKKEIKNESIMTREDFAIYEGHSTKIISFEIDY